MMDNPQSFGSVASDSTSSRSSPGTKPPHTFLDDFSFLLLQFLVQENDASHGTSTTNTVSSDQVTPALASLQAVLHAAKPAEGDGDLSLLPSASAELFLLRFKQLLEQRVHEKQAALLTRRLSSTTGSEDRDVRVVSSSVTPEIVRPLCVAVKPPSQLLCQLHGDLLLHLQQHLCENMVCGEDSKADHGGFAGVIFPEHALALQHRLLDEIESVLAQCGETAGGGAHAPEGFLRELASARRRLSEARHQDACLLTVHEMAHCPHDTDDGDSEQKECSDSGPLMSGFGCDDGNFVQHAVRQHLWLLWRMLRQRFTAYPSWTLLERARRFVVLPSKSPSPVVPLGAVNPTEHHVGGTEPAQTAETIDERASVERPFHSPPPQGVNEAVAAMADNSTPLRPPPLVAHTQTKTRSPLVAEERPSSISIAPSEDAVPFERVRRETQKPATRDRQPPELAVLNALTSLQSKLPSCPVYDQLLIEISGFSH